MRRRLAIIAAGLSLAAPGVAVAAVDMADGSGTTGHVSIQFGSVTPTKIDVLAGESVDWANDSVRKHTVTADDGGFDSGTLSPGGHYSRMFGATGSYAYHCSLHPYIRGEVDVHDVLLDRPAAPASGQQAYPLTGRAALPAGSDVAIQFDAGDGGGWHAVAETQVGSDGHFAVSLQPKTSGSYRAVSGDQASPPVDLLVLNQVVTATRHGRRITVSVAPEAMHATVVLQLRLKERFGWWPVLQHKLDMNSSTSFMVPRRRHVRARVVLTLPDGATPLAFSKLLRL